MNRPPPPAYWQKAKEIAARVASPVGKPFAAAKKKKTCSLYLYDAIGKDPWTDAGIDPSDVLAAVNGATDAEELAIHINSPGGYVFDGVAIYNAIRAFKGKKTVYVDGLAASIASIIALAGDRVVMNEGSMFMIHDPMGGVFAFGTADQIEDDARKTVSALRKVRETLVDVYVNATGQPSSQVSAWMTAETWMTAAEAKERGFADEVVTASDMGCDCEGPCGDDCPCEGECTGACECDCPEANATNAAPPRPPARARTAEELFAQACADAADIRARFAGGQPSAQQKPGQPGADLNASKPARRQEQTK